MERGCLGDLNHRQEVDIKMKCKELRCLMD